MRNVDQLCWGCKQPLEQIEKAFDSAVWTCANNKCPRFGLLTVTSLRPSKESKKELEEQLDEAGVEYIDETKPEEVEND